MKAATSGTSQRTNGVDSTNAEPARRRGRPHRRESLFAAARVALAEKTILDVTVDDIVREAGVARGTFYIYFTDKFDLLRALTERLVEEQVSELVGVRGKYENKLEEFEESALRAIKRWEANAPVYRAVFQLAMIREDFHDLRDQLQIPIRAREAHDIQQEIEAGRARKNIDPRVFAAAKNRMYELIVMEWFGWGKPPYDGATVEDVARQIASIWYHAIYPDSVTSKKPEAATAS